MSTATRVRLADAAAISRELVDILELGCERIEVAGSIRRRRPDVGDIELVAVPRLQTVTIREGLFESREVVSNELEVLVDAFLLDGTLRPHPTDPKRGPKYSKLLHRASGLQVDLFSARPETFGLIYLIRTGPAEYSQRFVTDIRSLGWHVGHGELHRGALACADRLGQCEIHPTPEEHDVYAAIGHPWIDPTVRDGLAALGAR